MATTRINVDISIAPYIETVVDVHTGGPTQGTPGSAFTSSTGTSHAIALPDGALSGTHLLMILGHDNNIPVDLSADMVALGWTLLAGDSWPPDYDFDVLWRNVTGTEGYQGSGDTITLTTGSSTDVVAATILFDDVFGSGVGSYWDAAQGLATANPGSLNPGWGAGVDAYWVTALLSESAISGDPTGFTNLGSDDTGTLFIRASGMYSTGATKDPSTYTSSSPILAWTISIRDGFAAGGTTRIAVDMSIVPYIETVVDIHTGGISESG